jgi:hypothetical protein
MAGRVIKLVAPDLVYTPGAGAYAVGNQIGGSLVTFALPDLVQEQGHILAASIAVTPASGNLIIAAMDFILWIWRSAVPVEVPTTVADGVTFPLTAAQLISIVGRFNFANAAWTNQLGAVSAGTTGVQRVLDSPTGNFGSSFNFNDAGLAFRTTRQLFGAIVAAGTWTPGAVQQTFKVRLDVELGRD